MPGGVGDNFTVMHINIQSIKNKLDELEVFLMEHNVDIACITESWCRPDETDCIKVAGYSVVANFCRSSRIHGGCLILARDAVGATNLSVLV